jgi:hypothetical protein
MRPSSGKSPFLESEIEAGREERIMEQAAILVERLERISADSIWAHRSSGLRGSLLRVLDDRKHGRNPSEARPDSPNIEQLDRLIKDGYYLLEKAAREY